MKSAVRHIAVATDESDGGAIALTWAAELVGSFAAELVAIEIAPAGEVESVRSRLEASLSEAGIEATARVAAGDDIGAAIVAEATAAGADLIVIGSSGMRDRKRFLLGNVANRVTHLAHCTVIVVNTSLGGVAAISEKPGALSARAEEIARVLGPLVLGQLAARLIPVSPRADGPRRVRESLERLGPTFGKLGQVLSTRPDLLSEDYLAELASLQADVPPMSEAEVVATMEAELSVPWEDVFASIEPEPLAAGTIGQVHRATLVGGERVVVKVQRSTAAGLIEQDLKLLSMAVGPAARSRRVRRVVDLPSIVDQLADALRAELDFGEEARNLKRMGEILATYGRLAVPAVHDSLSTSRLLVMDEIVDGVPIAEAPRGPSVTEATRELMHAYYRQVLEEGFFHADPHPGNLMWAEDRIWLLDLGMVGRVDDGTRRLLLLILLAFVEGDLEMLVDVSLDLSGRGEEGEIDRDAYRDDLARVLTSVEGRSLEEIQVVELLNELTAISMRHGVPLPTGFVMVGKALTQVELTVTELAPEVDPFDEARRYFMTSIRRRLFARLDPQGLVLETERVRRRLGQIGEGLATVAGTRPGRRLEVRFTSRELERRVVRTGRMIGLGLGAGLTWLAAVEASTSDRVDSRMATGLRGLASGLSAWFAVEAARRR